MKFARVLHQIHVMTAQALLDPRCALAVGKTLQRPRREFNVEYDCNAPLGSMEPERLNVRQHGFRT